MDDDQEQQRQDDEERMAHNLAALNRIKEAGLPEVARDLASELGVSKEFNQKETYRG